MAYIYFDFSPNTAVYIKNKDGSYSDYSVLIVDFFRNSNINYYRLNNGHVLDEKSLLGVVYQSPISYYTKFALNDPAYIITSARDGFLEEIIIKEIVFSEFSGGISFQDTFNGVWATDELATLDEANAIIESL